MSQIFERRRSVRRKLASQVAGLSVNNKPTAPLQAQASAPKWDSESWKFWAEAAGEVVGTRKRLADALKSRGYTPKKGTAGDSRLGSGNLSPLNLH